MAEDDKSEIVSEPIYSSNEEPSAPAAGVAGTGASSTRTVSPAGVPEGSASTVLERDGSGVPVTTRVLLLFTTCVLVGVDTPSSTEGTGGGVDGTPYTSRLSSSQVIARLYS